MALDPNYDSAKANGFAERLLTTLNDGALCLMISIGHRTGLLDAMRDAAPATSAEIAAKAGLNERYVREWLGAMVTGRIVDVDPATNRFSLPAEHAAFLTRSAGADNIGVFTQYIGLLGSVEDDIVECFKKGGGVPYAEFPRFHEVMAEDSGQSVLSSLDRILCRSYRDWPKDSRAGFKCSMSAADVAESSTGSPSSIRRAASLEWICRARRFYRRGRMQRKKS